jgi:phytoene desaturase
LARHVIVIGAGLGGLATALRLLAAGYTVEIIEKHHQAGGRLNQLVKDGFTFDVGPSFFSMSYEFDELFSSVGIVNPLKLIELDPLYAVYFSNRKTPYRIHKDLSLLAKQFPEEANFETKAEKYLSAAGKIFHDTEYRIVKRNYSGVWDYLLRLTTVPLRHAPKLFRSMWSELSRHFTQEEVKIIFSLVAFFLGATPFNTPAVYSLLNYTELKHNGYWCVVGGMYQIVTAILTELAKRNVKIHYNTEIQQVISHPNGKRVKEVIDTTGKRWQADIFVSNSDAAGFRGIILKRPRYNEKKLDAMHWTLAPFTIYLGVAGQIPDLYHHTYFLGNNFKAYANSIFRQSVSPEKPYYYVNVSSKTTPECAPPGCENIFVLCPVPDLRFKPDWSDAEKLADTILLDMSERIGFDLQKNTRTRTIYTPIDWQQQFNLYKGSGLGLAHGLNQVGGLRPSNKDEEFNNLYYVGASTIPGTGLPIVVISSKLVTQRIVADDKKN